MSKDYRSLNLTARRIRDAKPQVKTVILWDRELKGLGVRVTAKGAKSFILNYRVDGRERRATLGRCAELSLKDARELAGRELAAIRAGEGDPLRRRQEARGAPTVAAGLDRFFSEFVPRRVADGRMGGLTVRDYQGQARRTVRPRLGAFKVADVKRADIERAVEKLPPVQRNRTLAFLSRLFTVFEEWEWRAPNSNPARRIEKAREEPRDRVLAPSEIAALGEALAASDAVYAPAAIRFLMLTGWRSGEALSLQWERVNFETGEAVLPSTKTGRDVRRLGAFALELLAGLPRINDNPHVFAGQGTRALSYAMLRRAFHVACEAAGIADARLHDIRRSVATSAAAHGISVFMLRDLLGHKTTAMANRYARRADSALQAAQDANASRMAAILDGTTGDLVPLRKRT